MLYSNNVLLQFDMIVDIEVGIIRLLHDKYNNDKWFYPGILEMPDKNLIYELHIRKNSNPLSIATTEECSQELIDSWYNELMTNNYHEILERSILTGLYNFLIMCGNSNGVVKIDILCNNELEEQYIKKLDIPVIPITIIQPNHKQLNISGYDSLYIKNYDDILTFKQVQGKNIFIGNYKFNLEPDEKGIEVPKLIISTILAPYNKIQVIDVYPIDATYIAKG